MFGCYHWEAASSLKKKEREVDMGGRREVVGEGLRGEKEGETVVRMEYMREEKIHFKNELPWPLPNDFFLSVFVVLGGGRESAHTRQAFQGGPFPFQSQ